VRAIRAAAAAALLAPSAACSREPPRESEQGVPPRASAPQGEPASAPQGEPASPRLRPAGSRPNVLLVSLDTTRADALSPYGAPEERTPALARLAREGVVLETAISPAPITLPSHATMFTGLDPSRHSVRDNAAYVLPESAFTLAEALSEAGWRTFAAVASVILLPRFGLDQGFETYDATGLAVTRGLEHERTADAVADAALKLVSGPEPFFGFVHFYDPHWPYRPPAELEQRFGDPYFAEIHLADRAVGRLLDALEREGRLERTIVVVTADHGESRGEHGESTHSVLLHEATQHVPLLFRAPGIEPRRAGGVIAALADLMPTLLELLGVAVPPGLDGRSLVPALRGEEMQPGLAYLESLYPQRSFDFAPLFGVRTPEWKLVLGSRAHLWRIAEDRREERDLASSREDVVAALTRRILQLRDGRGAALTVEESAVTAEELAVFGGLGYATGGGVEPVGEDSQNRPDPYDDIRGAEAIGAAGVLAGEGRTDEAIALLEKLAQRYPASGHVRQALGALYGQRGRHKKALDELLAAVKLRPRSPHLQMAVALAAWHERRPELVRLHLEAATGLPGCPARAFLLLAETLGQASKSEAARAVLRRLLERSDLSEQDRAEAQAALRQLGE
jgi:arylsulfatase A-like enzyme